MSKIIESIASVDGFRMPGEFEKHIGTIMIWPVRPGSWCNGGVAAKRVFTALARLIARQEKLYMLTDSEHIEEAESYLYDEDFNYEGLRLPDGSSIDCAIDPEIRANIKVLNIESDDSWARDVAPTFVVGSDDKGNSCVRGINWSFNAWGGEFDGLYPDWDKDDKLAAAFCEEEGYDYYDASGFVLEGGSIHSDGEGTIIVTEACLLSQGRNPHMTKEQIEGRLLDCLGARKVIWLPNGIYNDETNEHVDNVCAFTAPGEVVLAWTDDESDPQYPFSKAALEVLERETDACGRHLKVHKLYIPEVPVTVTEECLEGYDFVEGEDVRELGERLAASYANFYIANNIALVPQFGDNMDMKALELLKELMPDRAVIGVPAMDIITGGGNIHCITQQIPRA